MGWGRRPNTPASLRRLITYFLRSPSELRSLHQTKIGRPCGSRFFSIPVQPRVESPSPHRFANPLVSAKLSIRFRLRSRQGRFHMGSTSQMIWSVIFGSVGLGFFIYGKKQKATIPLIAGIALFIFPYFVANTNLLVFSGCAISAIPFMLK